MHHALTLLVPKAQRGLSRLSVTAFPTSSLTCMSLSCVLTLVNQCASRPQAVGLCRYCHPYGVVAVAAASDGTLLPIARCKCAAVATVPSASFPLTDTLKVPRLSATST